MYVDASVRGQRIGGRMLAELEAAARCGRVGRRCSRPAPQPEAVRLYERCG